MWELKTGGRLHFGLMELCEGAANRYAGLGVMLQNPELILRSSCSSSVPSISILNDLDRSSRHEYELRLQKLQSERPIAGNIAVVEAFPFHCGLGCGTQLACAFTAIAMLRDRVAPRESGQWQTVWQLLGNLDTDELACQSGRGLRSAIGLHGFLHGGLILDHGYVSDYDNQRTVTAQHCSLPQGWTFVLIRGLDNSTITGSLERDMIRKVANSINPHKAAMMELALAVLMAASGDDFGAFCDQLEQYLELSSSLFAPAQGGRFNGAVCAQSAAVARDMGLRAVGQSSWGPTVFGIVPTREQADYIVSEIAQRMPEWRAVAATAAATGAIARQVVEQRDQI